jgi:hypothetical protein
MHKWISWLLDILTREKKTIQGLRGNEILAIQPARHPLVRRIWWCDACKGWSSPLVSGDINGFPLLIPGTLWLKDTKFLAMEISKLFNFLKGLSQLLLVYLNLAEFCQVKKHWCTKNTVICSVQIFNIRRKYLWSKDLPYVEHLLEFHFDESHLTSVIQYKIKHSLWWISPFQNWSTITSTSISDGHAFIHLYNPSNVDLHWRE